MIASDIKPGAVYQYRNLVGDDLYVVLKVLDDVFGTHMWLCLTGPDAGEVDVETRPTTYGWEYYTLVEAGT